MLQDETKVEAFTEFVKTHESGLRAALTASLGLDVGREAAAEALTYGWEHWERIKPMENPAGYLYRVGRNWGGRKLRKRRIVFPRSDVTGEPWVEPELPRALAELPERQRVVVWLLHSSQWSMSEIAGLLGISKSTVQRHAERGMSKLRRRLGVAP